MHHTQTYASWLLTSANRTGSTRHVTISTSLWVSLPKTPSWCDNKKRKSTKVVSSLFSSIRYFISQTPNRLGPWCKKCKYLILFVLISVVAHHGGFPSARVKSKVKSREIRKLCCNWFLFVAFDQTVSQATASVLSRPMQPQVRFYWFF